MGDEVEFETPKPGAYAAVLSSALQMEQMPVLKKAVSVDLSASYAYSNDAEKASAYGAYGYIGDEVDGAEEANLKPKPKIGKNLLDWIHSNITHVPTSETWDDSDLKEKIRARIDDRMEQIASLANFDWNEQFQTLHGMIASTPIEMKDRSEGLQNLVNSFSQYGEAVAEVVVLQREIGISKIEPIEGAKGLAGGEKFRVGNTIVKFAHDWLGIYGSELLAQRAAQAEILGMTEVVATTTHLHTTLTALLRTFGGKCVIVTALAPIAGSDSIVYGSDDAGKTIMSEDPSVTPLINNLADACSLALHKVVDGQGKEHFVRLAVDVECHRSPADGRFYLLDLARMLPPTPPRLYGSHGVDFLTRHFRPEFMTKECPKLQLTLSSDGFSHFGRFSDVKKVNADIRKAFFHLRTATIPELAERLDKVELAELHTFSLAVNVHESGVNMRFLLEIAEHMKTEANQAAVIEEAIARSFKSILRLLVLETDLVATNDKCVKHIIKRMFGPEQDQSLWNDVLPEVLTEKFIIAKNDEDAHEQLEKMKQHPYLIKLRDACKDVSTPMSKAFYERFRAMSLISGGDLIEAMVDSNRVEMQTKIMCVQPPPFQELDKVEGDIKHALELREQALDSKTHPSLVLNLMQLLGLYQVWFEEQPEESYEKGKAVVDRIMAIHEEHNITNAPLICGRFFRHFGKFSEAEVYFNKELEEAEENHGKDSLEVALASNELALNLGDMGQFQRAMELYKHALAIREERCDPNGLEIAVSCNNLALMLNTLSDQEGAMKYYQRALAIWEKTLNDHPNVAICLNNIGELYRHMGKWELAENSHKRACSIWKQTLGEDHPDGKNLGFCLSWNSFNFLFIFDHPLTLLCFLQSSILFQCFYYTPISGPVVQQPCPCLFGAG